MDNRTTAGAARFALRAKGNPRIVTFYADNGETSAVFEDARTWLSGLGGWSETLLWIDLGEDGGLICVADPDDEESEQGDLEFD